MNLSDLLSVTDARTSISVFDYETNKLLGNYDGKDSIDIELNERKIQCQYVGNNKLNIIVY